MLTAQGMQANQQVTFFSDGGDTVREVAEYLNPLADHILDWFHLTMRLTVLRQCARGLAKARARPDDRRTLDRRIESVKHYLWHRNVAEAHAGLEDEAATRMLKYVRDLDTYITNNAGSIVNYGERYRNGERISTAFTESTINRVVSKRMVKKQQMQWTPEGAHLLLQVRTQVLNDDWEATFRTWYPRLRPLAAQTTAAREVA